MPRGRKPSLTLDEQLEKITKEITTMEESLAEMKKAKEGLETQIKMNRLAELDTLITEKGLTLDEVKRLLDR